MTVKATISIQDSEFDCLVKSAIPPSHRIYGFRLHLGLRCIHSRLLTSMSESQTRLLAFVLFAGAMLFATIRETNAPVACPRLPVHNRDSRQLGKRPWQQEHL